ncbi:MAG TPA: ornithine carbamoyltransferase, partial [Actinobacteria bacterium]|nr:ornithine carbamoyltransferase [Actinomycetes bacterium]HEX21416.1 ornithine carbamoyltransferase [Actinomycetota bacterium]
MSKRDFLSLADFKPDEIYHLLAKAMDFKRQRRQNKPHRLLRGKTVALIFSKPSTRTRVSFETAIADLGADSIFLNANDLQLGRGETIEDTGKVLSRYVDALVVRTHDHSELEALAAVSSIPIINALTNKYHPCQALADLMTILEKKDRLSGIKLAYLGDGNNVCNSLMLAAAKVGIKLSVASPKGYEPQASVIEEAKALKTGLNGIKITRKITSAVKGADVIY